MAHLSMVVCIIWCVKENLIEREIACVTLIYNVSLSLGEISPGNFNGIFLYQIIDQNSSGKANKSAVQYTFQTKALFLPLYFQYLLLST